MIPSFEQANSKGVGDDPRQAMTHLASIPCFHGPWTNVLICAADRIEREDMESIVDIVIEAEAWESIGLPELAERAVRTSLRHLGLSDEAEVALLATDDARILRLNADFRAKESATNVLSWPAEDLSADAPGGQPAAPEADFPGEPVFLGDVALAWETCAREAAEAGKPVEAHVCHLVVHGLLHLLGYDHISDEDADLMERIEIEILGKLGLPDPY